MSNVLLTKCAALVCSCVASTQLCRKSPREGQRPRMAGRRRRVEVIDARLPHLFSFFTRTPDPGLKGSGSYLIHAEAKGEREKKKINARQNGKRSGGRWKRINEAKVKRETIFLDRTKAENLTHTNTHRQHTERKPHSLNSLSNTCVWVLYIYILFPSKRQK